MNGTALFWSTLTEYVNSYHKMLQKKPRLFRRAFRSDPGSILNAYREGDLTFKQAVKELEKWRRSSSSRSNSK